MKRFRATPFIAILGLGYVLYSFQPEISDAYRFVKENYSPDSDPKIESDIIDINCMSNVDDIIGNAKALEAEEVIKEEVISSELLDSGYDFKMISAEEAEEMLAINPDTIGRIVIDGTSIDYTLVQGDDNDYYLHHALDGSDSACGTIFLDFRDTSLLSPTYELSDVNVIYGHHMGQYALYRMFQPLVGYKNQSFYDNHPFGIIYTTDGYAYKLDFFAGCLIPGDSQYQIYHPDFTSEEEFNEFVNNKINSSTFTSDVEVPYGSTIVALQTCSYEEENLRYVVFAVATKQYTNENQLFNSNNVLGR